MQRYFGEVFEGRAILSEGDVFHLTKVMRCQIGTEIEIVSDGRVFISRVEKVKPLSIKVLKQVREDHELSSDIILIMAPLKGDKTELVLQKATELGVHEIVLVHTLRTIVKFKTSDIIAKLSRYQRILKEAAEQSQRIFIPTISYLESFKKISSIRAHHKLLAYELQSGPTTALNKALKQIKKKERVAMIIGPEGGFSNEEVDEAKTIGYLPISLGKRILRAETASIYALSVIAHHLES
jgi:16S rRNA (uracil1498-N3)-methyltransferase